MAISWVLKPQHRSRVMFQRFMPWRNAQKRKELAEKKEAEQRKKEAERRQAEILKEQQEEEAMLLEEQIHKEPEETKHLDENGDLGENAGENTRQDEELLNEQKGSGKLQENKRNTIECLMAEDQQDKKFPDENIDKLSIKTKNIDVDKKNNSKKEIEIKKVPSDNRRDMTQVQQVVNNQVCVKQDLNQIELTLNQDDQNVKRGMKCNVKNQVEISKEDIQQKNIKQNSDETKHEINKNNSLKDKCTKIENNKDVGKLNFENNDIIKAHTGNESKNKIITVNE